MVFSRSEIKLVARINDLTMYRISRDISCSNMLSIDNLRLLLKNLLVNRVVL